MHGAAELKTYSSGLDTSSSFTSSLDALAWCLNKVSKKDVIFVFAFTSLIRTSIEYLKDILRQLTSLLLCLHTIPTHSLQTDIKLPTIYAWRQSLEIGAQELHVSSSSPLPKVPCLLQKEAALAHVCCLLLPCSKMVSRCRLLPPCFDINHFFPTLFSTTSILWTFNLHTALCDSKHSFTAYMRPLLPVLPKIKHPSHTFKTEGRWFVPSCALLPRSNAAFPAMDRKNCTRRRRTRKEVHKTHVRQCSARGFPQAGAVWV